MRLVTSWRKVGRIREAERWTGNGGKSQNMTRDQHVTRLRNDDFDT